TEPRPPCGILSREGEKGSHKVRTVREVFHACFVPEAPKGRGGRGSVRAESALDSPAVVYEGDDLDLSDGVAVRNVRSFRI
ncbi:MAG: hypothetical protein J6Y19_06275, partial [Kiritimatiellae bacterium]|nr:hypothetical protein [Kiritimatiellia bacterium]